MVAARGGTGQDRARRKRMVTEQSLALPRPACAGRPVAKVFVWLLCRCCARGRAGEAGRLVEITKGLLGFGRVLLFSVVFKTASRTDGFPGSICTEGVCRY